MGEVDVFMCCHAMHRPSLPVERKRMPSLRRFRMLSQQLPSDQSYVVLGDSNARPGARGMDDEWWYERGPHGYGELNDAGR